MRWILKLMCWFIQLSITIYVVWCLDQPTLQEKLVEDLVHTGHLR